MQDVGMLLLVHGDDDSSIDIFDREKFFRTILADVVNDFPSLKIVLEHITTKDVFVNNAADNVAATITAHHLLYNRNHMLAGGIRPHYYCLPILKRNIHQQALIAAATSGSSFSWEPTLHRIIKIKKRLLAVVRVLIPHMQRLNSMQKRLRKRGL